MEIRVAASHGDLPVAWSFFTVPGRSSAPLKRNPIKEKSWYNVSFNRRTRRHVITFPLVGYNAS